MKKNNAVSAWFFKILYPLFIFCDGWIAPNALEDFRYVGHFTNEKKKLQALLLALVEVEGAHTGEQLAAYIFMVLD